MSEELKPCPFCGGRPVMITGGRYRVRCTKCYVTMPGRHLREEAVQGWNCRIGEEQRRKKMSPITRLFVSIAIAVVGVSTVVVSSNYMPGWADFVIGLVTGTASLMLMFYTLKAKCPYGKHDWKCLAARKTTAKTNKGPQEGILRYWECVNCGRAHADFITVSGVALEVEPHYARVRFEEIGLP